jgi:hypothetical protein
LFAAPFAFLPSAVNADGIIIAIGKVMTLRAPPGTRFLPGTGDSAAGSLAGDGFSLSLDYGVYSDPLIRPDFGSLLRAEDVVIDGRAGRFYLWRSPPGQPPIRIGLHVASVAPTVLGPLRLTITGLLANESSAERVAAMFRTIRFLDAN